MALASASPARAQSSAIGFQAKLTGVADGPHVMKFSLYDVATGGTPLQTVGPQNVTVQGGVVSTAVAFDPVHWTGQERWIAFAADTGGESEPRISILSTPFSLASCNTVGTTGIPSDPSLNPVRASLNGATPRAWLYSPMYSLYGSPFPSFQAMVPGGEIGSPGSFLPPGTQLFAALGAAAQRTIGFGFYSNWYSSGGTNGDIASAVVWIKDGANNVFDVVKVSEHGYVVDPTKWLLRVSVNGDTASRGLAVYDSGGDARTFVVTGQGHTTTKILTITGGSDLAEPFAASADDAVEPQPGMVMSIDPENPGALRVCTSSYDTTVAGVFSGGNGLNTGMIMGQEGCELTASGEGKVPLAMTGRVWVYADDSNGAIKPGDRLTTSGSKPGHAMKVTDETRSIGAVIGKAMTKVDPDSGMVMVLVNLQ